MLSRREMLAFGACAVVPSSRAAIDDIPLRDGIPQVDYHVHIGDEITVDGAVELSRRRGVKFGLLQHAGKKGEGYAISDDDSLLAWVRSLEGKRVFKGIEAESVEWMPAFSKSAVARLDYVQADPLGVPDRSGAPLQIWKTDFRPGDPREFMDRYVDFHLQRISTPIDILAVPTFLPPSLSSEYHRLWTEQRMRTVIEAAVRANVAVEIDCRFRVPRLPFLQMAKAAGARFSFGSNYQTRSGVGDISYCVAMYKRLGLTSNDIFRPAGAGKRF